MKRKPRKSAKSVKLPNKPSALIRLALRDLRRVEATPGMKVDMGSWVYQNKVCHVCFAGSVMSKTCGLKNVEVWEDLSQICGEENANKFLALNSLREGGIGDAFEFMGLSRPERLPKFVDVPSYPEDCDLNDLGLAGYLKEIEKFHAAMSKLADRLERHGF